MAESPVQKKAARLCASSEASFKRKQTKAPLPTTPYSNGWPNCVSTHIASRYTLSSA